MNQSNLNQQKIFNPGPEITYGEQVKLTKPKPPTEEMVKKAQFIDKTYIWKNAGVRPGDGRSPK